MLLRLRIELIFHSPKAKRVATLIALLTGVMFLGACAERNENSVRLHQYDSTEQIYEKALELARSEHPSYFSIAKEVGVENQIKGFRILGADYECVYFLNMSSIIIEEALPLYCFKNDSLEFFQKL